MQNSLPTILNPLQIFSQLFSRPVWVNCCLIMTGAILSSGKRTITSLLRILKLDQDDNFHKYHWFFSGANWCAFKGAQILLGKILEYTDKNQPLVFAFDETVEKRKGKNIKHIGFYRDAVNSSRGRKASCFGLKWLCCAVIVKMPWATRPWALPFFSVLTPPKKEIGKTQNKQLKSRKSFVEYTCQMIKTIMKWVGKSQQEVFFTADGNFATFSISATCKKLNAKFISRLRWNASLYDINYSQGKGRKRVKGKKLPAPLELLNDPSQKWVKASVRWYGGVFHNIEYLNGVAIWYKAGKEPIRIKWVIVRDLIGRIESTILMCTDEEVEATKIIEIFVQRWNIEVTFEEVHERLGWGSQRHWSDKAIERVTPSLLGLYSMICVIGLSKAGVIKKEETAWYKKREATYSDLLKAVRKEVWEERYKLSTAIKAEDEKVITELIELLCKAA